MRPTMITRLRRQWYLRLGLREVFGAAAAVVVLASLLGCDKGTGPKPAPKYLLYAAMVAPQGQANGFIAVIDCETDSIIDSVKNLSEHPGVVASPDGKYLAAISAGSPPLIIDAVNRTRIKSLAAPGLLPLFLPDAGILVYPDFDSTCVYSVPEFVVKEVWPRPRFVVEHGPGKGHLATIERRGDNLRDRSKLVIFEYLNYRAVDSVVIDPDAQDVGFQIMNFTFSPDGARLYATGGQRGFGSGVVGYDLRTRETLFRQSLYGPFGYCRVTPDGREVWVTDPGYPIEDSPGWPQTIFIFDAVAGTLLDTVSIRNISPSSAEPLAAQDIRFVPDGSKAYVNCGSFFKGNQPILVISTRTRRVDRLIFGGFEDRAVMIDIAQYP